MNYSSLLRRLNRMSMVLAVTLMPVTASALDTEKVPSIGADTGRFNLPIECGISLPDLGGMELATINATADIEGVAPVQLGPGQDFFLSQGSGTLTLPPWISTLGGLFTFNRADAELDSLRIGAANATPDVIDLADTNDLRVEDIPVKVGEPVSVGLPKTGSFLVGPYAAPRDGRIQFRFDGASANVTLKSKTGLNIKVRATCQAAEGNSLLSVAVGDEVDPSTPALYENEPLDFAPVEEGHLIGIVHAPYHCTIGGEQYRVGIAVGATIPLAVERFGSIEFREASGAITLPAETVNRLLDAGYTSVRGRVEELNLIVEDGYIANTNVLPGGTDIPSTPLQADTPVTVSLPTDSTVTAGPFFPNWFAESMIVGLGSASASLRFNGGGETVEASCPRPEPDAYLIDAPII